MVVTRRWAAGEAVRPPLQSMWHAHRSGAPTPCAGSCRTPCLGNSSLEADRRYRLVVLRSDFHLSPLHLAPFEVRTSCVAFRRAVGLSVCGSSMRIPRDAAARFGFAGLPLRPSSREIEMNEAFHRIAKGLFFLNTFSCSSSKVVVRRRHAVRGGLRNSVEIKECIES